MTIKKKLHISLCANLIFLAMLASIGIYKRKGIINKTKKMLGISTSQTETVSEEALKAFNNTPWTFTEGVYPSKTTNPMTWGGGYNGFIFRKLYHPARPVQRG